jgi:hypothetical protein
MPVPKLTRAERRRLRELAVPIKRITQGDLAYFERFPHRRHRLREADVAEIEQAELIYGPITPGPGERHYRAIRYLPPDACLSLPICAPSDGDPESLDERLARAAFECIAPDRPPFLEGRHGLAEFEELERFDREGMG